jgi:hypothetical protein
MVRAGRLKAAWADGEEFARQANEVLNARAEAAREAGEAGELAERRETALRFTMQDYTRERILRELMELGFGRPAANGRVAPGQIEALALLARSIGLLDKDISKYTLQDLLAEAVRRMGTDDIVGRFKGLPGSQAVPVVLPVQNPQSPS